MKHDIMLIDNAESYNQVEEFLTKMYGVPEKDVDGGWYYDLPGQGWINLWYNDYIDEPLLPPVSHYWYGITTTGSQQIQLANTIMKETKRQHPEWQVLRIRDRNGMKKVVSEPKQVNLQKAA